ncbi:MAG: histidine kinase [Bacteroidetes bacterium]|nr:histidine kinase [Bacteroidota bacterium]
MKLGLPSGRNLKISLHILVWVGFFILPIYIFYVDSQYDSSFLFRSYIQTAAYALVFYLNYLWLTPGLFFRKKKLLYFVGTVSMVVIMTVCMEITDRYTIPHPEDMGRFDRPPSWQGPGPRPPDNPPEGPRPSKNWPTYNFIMTNLLISGLSLGLRFSEKLIQNEKEKRETEKEKLRTELAFLKSQINPHFFFNTLNNIYSLVVSNPNEGQKAILQLSKLMRYLLYDTEHNYAKLSQEIDFLKNYLELMKLRLSNKVKLTVTFPEKCFDLSIPPLIFLPFIENAFKHGISYRKPSYIFILISVHPESVYFECKNSQGGQGETLKSDSGIGLENVKKRLALLFHDNHRLTINSTDDDFEVTLTIQRLHEES